jgi:hypothetical protein
LTIKGFGNVSKRRVRKDEKSKNETNGRKRKESRESSVKRYDP